MRFTLPVIIYKYTKKWILTYVIPFENIGISKSALYDNLTGLPNRTLLYERLDRIKKVSDRYVNTFAIMFIDLDGFKSVNDTYGHEAGDDLLKQVSQRLLNSVRASDTVSRYGGNEFIILLSVIHTKEECEKIAENILKKLSEKLALKKAAVNIGGSIGITIVDKDMQSSSEEMIKKADNAMYKVKKNGKNSYMVV